MDPTPWIVDGESRIILAEIKYHVSTFHYSIRHSFSFSVLKYYSFDSLECPMPLKQNHVC